MAATLVACGAAGTNYSRTKDKPSPFQEHWESTMRKMQGDMCTMLERVENNSDHRFREDVWRRKEGGGGWTRVLQDGKVFEKAGVNVSSVFGELPKAAAAQMKSRGVLELMEDNESPKPFFACGVSLVVHPNNPFAPTMHANYRYFEVTNPRTGKVVWWFGGGADLTPSYLFEEDARLFHQAHKRALDKHDETLYPKFKKWCDEYFYLPHRGETRGVGGIFYDDMDALPGGEAETEDTRRARLRAMAMDLFAELVSAYEVILERRKNTTFTEANKRWQQLRRGRYVEFNVGIDRGTRFGMQTPGSRIESIFMSLPLTARWEYDVQVVPGSPEDKLQQVLKKPRDWVASPLEDASFASLLEEVGKRAGK
jgi:coproporphyrinogen III oxidase